MSKMLTTLTLAAVTAVSLAATAEARGRHHHHHHHHNHHHGFKVHRFVHVYAAPIRVPSCGDYYAKWQYTGSRYWKHKYLTCKGW